MSGYIGTQPVPQATQTRETFTATAGQTSFATAGYTPNYLDVWLNGVKLVNGTDFTATNGSDVVLTSGAADGDTLEVLAFSTFDLLSQSFGGDLTVDSGNGNTVSMTTDGSIEIQKSNAQAYIDFKGSNVDFDCRIAQYNDGLKFEVGGSGDTKTALTLDSNGDANVGTSYTGYQAANRRVLRVDGADTSLVALSKGGGTSTSYLYYDGNLSFTNATSGGEINISTVGATGLNMKASGAINYPAQPKCAVTCDGGWRTFAANTPYGVSGSSFFYNTGGFYNGGTINGLYVVHVPVSGWYRFTLNCYYGGGIPLYSRLRLMRNQSEEILFLQNNVTGDGVMNLSALHYMSALDYVNYLSGGSDFIAYHAGNHTELQIELAY